MTASPASTELARVKTSFSNTALIQINKDILVEAKLHKKMLRPVCGDMITYTKNTFNEYIILDVLPRKNELIRKVKDNKLKIFAANISQMLIVVAVEPVYSRYLIDRYIAYADINNITPVLILNKTDLLTPAISEQHQNVINFYDALGYKTIRYTNANTDTAELVAVLTDNTSILVGQSGVGKSSLINKLLPSHALCTGELSRKTKEGTHTTTHTESYDLPFGGSIIDSPGVREFTPYFTDQDQVQYGFKEFLPLINHCKYRNCLHHYEKGCKIKEALENGEISQLRYNSYIDILAIYQN